MGMVDATVPEAAVHLRTFDFLWCRPGFRIARLLPELYVRDANPLLYDANILTGIVVGDGSSAY